MARLGTRLISGRDVPTLLPPERLRQCEAWKLAYADFLFRSELYGLRAELLAVRFVGEHAAGPGGQDAAASGSREDKGFSIGKRPKPDNSLGMH